MPRALPACSKLRLRQAQISSKAYIASMILHVISCAVFLLPRCIWFEHLRFWLLLWPRHLSAQPKSSHTCDVSCIQDQEFCPSLVHPAEDQRGGLSPGGSAGRQSARIAATSVVHHALIQSRWLAVPAEGASSALMDQDSVVWHWNLHCFLQVLYGLQLHLPKP